MKAYLVLCVAAALVGATRAECDACLDGNCYQKRRLFESKKIGNFVDIDRHRNILYSYMGSTLKQCQLNTGLCNNTTLHDWDIRAMTVDQRTGDYYSTIYDHGFNFYKLDLVNKDKTLLVRGLVYCITFKDKLYHVPRSGNGIFTFEDEEEQVVPGTENYNVYYFAVDKNDDIYFITYEIDIIRRASKGAVDRTIPWHSGIDWLTTDADGNVVFINWKTHAVYRDIDGQLIDFGAINDTIYRFSWYKPLLFDRDNNIIYQNDDGKYFHLKRDENINCNYSISQNTVIITETVVSATTYNIETTTSDTSRSTPAPDSTTWSTPAGNTEDSDVSSTTDGNTDNSDDMLSSTATGYTTEDNDDPSRSTPAPESTASTPDESGAGPSGTPNQQANDTEDEQQSGSSCQCPKLPNITIKVEFN